MGRERKAKSRWALFDPASVITNKLHKSVVHMQLLNTQIDQSFTDFSLSRKGSISALICGRSAQLY
jgi:hypothetical protein